MQRNRAVDAIPALINPIFVGPSDSRATYLADDNTVLGLLINGEAKDYPHNIGWSHEITNDPVDGRSIVVSFCPLTRTGMVFDAGKSGNRMFLGVSGNLFNNNLVMYDRKDDLSNATLYPQMWASVSPERDRAKSCR